MAAQRKFLKGVQTLRAAAALGVVLFHASDRAGAPLLIGEARVDLFFVISGLVLWRMRERYASVGEFLTERFFRVVPLYWIATGAMLVGALLHLYPHLHLSVPWVAGSFFFIATPSPNPGGGVDELWPLLTQGWTMNYEIFFYALFAMMLIAPAKKHANWLFGMILVLIALGLLAPITSPTLRFYTNEIMLEFLAGVAIAILMSRRLLPGKWLAILLLAIGVVTLLSPQIAHMDAPRAVVRGIPAALILLGVIALEEVDVAVSNGLLLFLGNASFSIYLFHDFGISLAHRFFPQMLPSLLSTTVYALVGVATGLCGYWLIEKPYVRLMKRLRRKAPRDVVRNPESVSTKAQ